VAQDIRYDKSHPSGGTPEARIASRLRNSGAGSGTTPDVTTKQGEGPTRVHHNLHYGTGGPGVSKEGEQR
jgi:hypothetical protein